MNVKRALVNVCSLFLYSGSASLNAQDSSSQSWLDEYVHRPDPSYSWSIHSSESTAELRYVVVELTSQTWLTEAEVDRTEWKHWLEIFIPKNVETNLAMLNITGGNFNQEAPRFTESRPAQIAALAGVVVAQISNVPAQPLVFFGDGRERSEDDLIAFSWTQFLKTENKDWIVQGPMAKSAVRAMDAVTEVLEDEEILGRTIDKFVVAGGSKRGWTTWLATIVDKRVVAGIPIVFDALNSTASMRHHFESYGYWSPSIGSYVNHEIMSRLGSPKWTSIMKVVDPFSYFDRINIPIFVINSTGDEFFLPDSSQFYFDEIPSQKSLRYIPNSQHSLRGTDVVESIAAFLSLMATQQNLPTISWSRNDDQSIVITADRAPEEVLLWEAENLKARDFRLLPAQREDGTIVFRGPTYKQSSLKPEAHGNESRYSIQVESPDRGWKAWLVEFTFDVGLPVPLKLTTDVQITPDLLPFEGKDHTQETWVTLHCAQAEQEESLSPKVTEFIRSQLKNADSVALHSEGRDYFSWNPNQEVIVEGIALGNFVESLGYQDCRFQLESGPGPTLPPLNQK